MGAWHYGFGDANADFTALLLADGLPAGIANTVYDPSIQANYKAMRAKGIGPVYAWNMSERSNVDQATVLNILNLGASPDLVVQAFQNNLLSTDPLSTTLTAIRAGQNPVNAINAGLQALGVTPVTTSSTGASQTVETDYMKNLPQGVSPGSTYTVTTATGTVTYSPDGTSTTAPLTPTQQQNVEAQIPADSGYWAFPSGDVETPGGTMSNTPAAGVTPPISLAGLTITPQILMIGAGVGVLGLMMLGGNKGRH